MIRLDGHGPEETCDFSDRLSSVLKPLPGSSSRLHCGPACSGPSPEGDEVAENHQKHPHGHHVPPQHRLRGFIGRRGMMRGRLQGHGCHLLPYVGAMVVP